MTKTNLMVAVVAAVTTACGTTDPKAENSANTNSANTNGENDEFSLTYDAFDTATSETVRYEFRDGFDFCPSEGALYRLDLDLSTGEGSAELLRTGDAATDMCMNGIDGTCWTSDEVVIELTAEELELLTQTIDDVPALGCTQDFECDLCQIDAVIVGDTTHATPCCFDGNVEAWLDDFNEVTRLLQSFAEAAEG